MTYDLSALNLNERIELDQDFTIDLNKFHNKDIVNLKNMHLTGYIYNNDIDNLIINLNVTGTMILKDSVTLEEISKEMSFKITEEDTIYSEYLNDYYKKDQNILDIIGVLWENIVLEVPISLTKEKDIKISGAGWSYGEQNSNNDIDPRLAKLNELLDNREE